METLQDVPGWLPVVGVVLTVLGYVIRIAQPLLNEHVDAFKRSKVDDFVFNAVSAVAETTARDIKEKTADGVYTNEEARELLVNLGKSTVEAAVEEFGKDYLGVSTVKKITDKVETAVVATKLGKPKGK